MQLLRCTTSNIAEVIVKHALHAVFEHVNAAEKPASLAWDEVQQWQAGVLADLLALGLLTKVANTQSLICKGCEQQCFMPVALTDDGERAFIVCDDPDQQEYMGRINVQLQRLQQWQASSRQCAGCVADLSGFGAKPELLKTAAKYRLGMLPSKKGRRWVSLAVQPLALEINGYAVPLADLLHFDAETLLIDQARIDDLLNTSPADSGNAYSANVSKREASKLATQAMYQDWRDEYIRLKKNHPTKPDTWISLQIAKLPIAQRKDSETIRHNMKKPRKLDEKFPSK